MKVRQQLEADNGRNSVERDDVPRGPSGQTRRGEDGQTPESGTERIESGPGDRESKGSLSGEDKPRISFKADDTYGANIV